MFMWHPCNANPTSCYRCWLTKCCRKSYMQEIMFQPFTLTPPLWLSTIVWSYPNISISNKTYPYNVVKSWSSGLVDSNHHITLTFQFKISHWSENSKHQSCGICEILWCDIWSNILLSWPLSVLPSLLLWYKKHHDSHASDNIPFTDKIPSLLQVTVEHGQVIRDVVIDLAMEQRLVSYHVHLASTKAVLSLDSDAALVEDQDILLTDDEIFEGKNIIIYSGIAMV